MEYLFSPFLLRDLRLRNRIVMPGLASFLIEDDGEITDETVEHYRARAAGGPAMVIVEACAVSPEGIVSRHQARIYDDRFLPGLARIAEAIRSEGAVPAVQIHHAGRQTSARVIGQKPLAPSPLPCPTIKGDVEPLTKDGIQELVHKFGQAAARAVAAGFALLEIHGAHGYLINQFLSRFSNIRLDEYGGDTAGRSRFASEIVAEVRQRVGAQFPISFKISAQEFVPDGLTDEESTRILSRLVEAGVDIVQISAGNDATPEWICQPMFMKKACLADSAARIRKALNVPVMAVGRINDPLIAEAIIAEEKADLVCVGRGLIADPEMPNKARAGRLDDIRVCIACNTCMESIFRKGRVECLVNPTLGREKEMAIQPAEARKKVMVVGGGPGGLNVAWVAAKRGHDVHLFEREAALGGQLRLGSVSSFKQELVSLIEFQKKQARKFGVTFHLNVHVTAETIRAEQPDELILATGSSPIVPSVPGVSKSIVMTLPEVLNGNKPLKRRIVVVGGGGTGCEVALHLAVYGCPVTIVEQLPKVGGQLESITKKVLLKGLNDNRVQIMTGYSLTDVEDNGVHIRSADGEERFLEAESVVITIGNRPEDRLFQQAKAIGIPVHQIGDCLEARSAKAAISEGALIARSI
jgi:2,4-dienoyl-CoA reductase-like NADH-dependent reductase (Old Yellow Enzyme family)/thioredoxin reductase